MFRGIIPPVTTPFANGEVAYDKLQDNLRRLDDTGLSGFVVLGSNGEAAYLTAEERRQVIAAARRAIPSSKPLIAGTGLESLKETIALTRAAADLGADAALVLTPAYYRAAMTPAALSRYYTAVAGAVSLPILIYNVPKFTGLSIEPATVAELAEHPNIVGIKDSVENLAHLLEIRHRVRDNFAVLVGTASVLYPGMCVGAQGGIVALANIAPAECLQIYRDSRSGPAPEALATQLRLLAVNRAVTAQYGVAGLKAALDMLGYYGGPPRAPLAPLGEADREELREILLTAGLLNASSHL